MKTKLFSLGIAFAALLVVQPVCSQENPTEKIKKESTKVINRNIDKLFGKKKKEKPQPLLKSLEVILYTLIIGRALRISPVLLFCRIKLILTLPLLP